MKVLSIGSDRKLFETGSPVQKRALEYGNLFDKLIVIVFSTRDKNLPLQLKLNEKAAIYSTNSSSKFLYFLDAYKIGRNLIKSGVLNKDDAVITVQDPFESGLAGLLLKIIFKFPLHVQLHTDFENKYFISHNFLNFLRFFLGLFVLSFADSVRCVSQKIASSIHFLSKNIMVLPIYSERNNIAIRKTQDSVTTVLTVARLEKEKNLETAILAFAEAAKNLNAKFIIVGQGSQLNALKKHAEREKIDKKIQFVGWRENLREYYERADIYISTSLFEGYGVSVVEAALSGLPLVLSGTGVAGDFFKNGKEAFVCKAKSIDEFGAALKKLLESKSLREEMGQSAKLSAESREVSREEYLRKYENSIREASDFYHSRSGIFKKNILFRYLVAGITAASSNILLLYLFTDKLKIWYLYSSVLAFLIALIVSFALQKYWAFGDKEHKEIRRQFSLFFAVTIVGIGINTALMYIFVDGLGIFYLLAQILTGAFIAVVNFLFYKLLIFKKP